MGKEKIRKKSLMQEERRILSQLVRLFFRQSFSRAPYSYKKGDEIKNKLVTIALVARAEHL
jgi:hypothetical protein